MSIIYDALKKSQKIRSDKKPKVIAARRDNLIRQNIVIMLLILTCLFTILMAATMPGNQFMRGMTLSKHDAKQKPINIDKNVLARKEPVFIIPKMRLDGVFLSNSEKLAMIDNKSYHIGDDVKGMQLVSITFDKVKLRHKKQELTLRNELAQ